MTRRSKVWLAVAAVFTLVNLAGAVMAAMEGELLHSGSHVALTFLGAYVVWRLAPGRYGRRSWGQGDSEIPTPPHELTDRLTQLEQSVDAVAIEVERIGEGQRFMTHLFTDTDTPRAPGEGDAGPIESKAREAKPDGRGY
jgi:hypothetical protein